MKNKNKRVVIAIAAIVAVVAVVSGIALFLIAPLFGGKGQKQQVSEKSGADILKAASSDLKVKFSGIMSTQASVNSAFDEVKGLDGSLDIEEAIINGKDYTEGKVLHYELSDLLNESSMSGVNSGYNTGLNTGMYMDMDTVSSMLENVDEETIKQYDKVARKMSGYMVTAVETVIDKSSYEKQTGTVQLSIGDEKFDAVAYKVVIPVSAVISSADKAIDDIFNDADIAPYITMLRAAGAQFDKDEMKNSLREQLKAESIYFTMYVKNEELCGIYMDGTWYDKDSNDKAEYLFWNNKFGFNINIENYEGNSCKLKGNIKIETNL